MIAHSSPWLNQADLEYVQKTMKSGMIAGGEKIGIFENAIKKLTGTNHVLFCGSGTEAILLALLALNIGSNDEVILPTYVCEAVLLAILAAGAKPVICDVSNGWIMSPADVNKCLSTNTKAIILVHIFGIGAGTEQFLQYDIPLIEDCCQAIGLVDNDQMVGTIGRVGIFSFQATKCMTTGEGGAIFSNDNELIKKCRLLTRKTRIGAKPTDLQATLGLSQINRYDEFLERRRKIADNYFDNLPINLTKQIRDYKEKSMFYRFPLSIQKGNFLNIQKEFTKRGISVRKGVDELLHHKFGMDDRKFQGAVSCFNKTVSIPIYPSLGIDEQQRIIDTVNEIMV